MCASPSRLAPAAMLAADKLLLRSTVKQRTIELREKEVNRQLPSHVATHAHLIFPSA